MNHFGSAVQRLFSTSDNDLTNNNILETTHHSQPVFEKIDPAKYFRINVRINRVVYYYYYVFERAQGKCPFKII